MKQKICKYCLKEFKPLGSNEGIYCSKSCYTDAFRIYTKCDKCGKDMPTKKKSYIRSKKHYCSRECRKTGKYKVCIKCGKDYYVALSRLNISNFCSRQCAGIYNGVKHKGYKMTLESRKKISLANKGEKGNNWKGGITKATQARLSTMEWAETRKKVYESDKWICRVCKKKCKGKEIQAHHINPWRYTKDDSLENLMTLCSSCHSKIEHRAMNKIRFKATVQIGKNGEVWLTSKDEELLSLGNYLNQKLCITLNPLK